SLSLTLSQAMGSNCSEGKEIALELLICFSGLLSREAILSNIRSMLTSQLVISSYCWIARLLAKFIRHNYCLRRHASFLGLEQKEHRVKSLCFFFCLRREKKVSEINNGKFKFNRLCEIFS